MKTIQNLLLCISILLSGNLCSNAVSFSVRNLSGAPIVGGVWRWEDRSPADIRGIIPINPGELKGWAWDDSICYGGRCYTYHITTVHLKREEKDPLSGNPVAFDSYLTDERHFPGNWDFALLPGGKIIKLRNYGATYEDIADKYVHPNFQTLYQGQIQSVDIPRVLMQDGKTYFGTVAKEIPASVILQDGTTLSGELKQSIPGTIILMDGTQLDEAQIKAIQKARIDTISGVEIPGKIKERRGDKVVIESSDPQWNNQEISLSNIKETPFKIVMKDGKEYMSPIKEQKAAKVIMTDGKEFNGIVKQQIKPMVVMDDNRQYPGRAKEIVKGKVIFTDGTVIDSNGNITKQ